MLDNETCKKVMVAINEGDGTHYGEIVTLEDVERMGEIKISTKGGLPIYAITKGDMTILVWIHSKKDEKVIEVQFTCW